MSRRQPVRAVDPAFGGEVLEVDPHGRAWRRLHRIEPGVGQPATEGLDDHVRGRVRCGGRLQGAHADAAAGRVVRRGVESRRDAREHAAVVDPQGDRGTVLGDEGARETQGDPRIPVVVDDAAGDVEAHGGYYRPMHASTEPLVIDVVSDVVCPWCFIGKRHLEAALAGLPEAAGAKVRWHPFELNPDLPAEGVDRKGYLEAKFGGPARAARSTRAFARPARAPASTSTSTRSCASPTRATRIA